MLPRQSTESAKTEVLAFVVSSRRSPRKFFVINRGQIVDFFMILDQLLSHLEKTLSQTSGVACWKIVNSPYGLDQDELRLQEWRSRIYPIERCSRRGHSIHPLNFGRTSFVRSNGLYSCEVQLLETYENYVVTSCFQLLNSLNFERFWTQRVSPSLFFFVIAPGFRFRKFPWFLTFVCCVRFLCYFVHQPAKVFIFQPPLRTRRCVGFWISSPLRIRFPWDSEYPRSFWCNRIFRGWGTCRNSWKTGSMPTSWLWFCHNYFFFFLFLHPLRHRFGAANQAGIPGAASKAEKANVEQMKEIVPFVTCEITFCQNVCELMFGVDVSNLNFRIKINSVKQPIQSNSVGSWHMSYCGTSDLWLSFWLPPHCPQRHTT